MPSVCLTDPIKLHVKALTICLKDQVCESFFDIADPSKSYDLFNDYSWGFKLSAEREWDILIRFYPDKKSVEANMLQRDDQTVYSR